MSLYSGLYTGRVGHIRKRPRSHQLEYPVYMVYTDLDEVDAIAAQHPLWSNGRRNISWFRRSDYYGNATQPLREAVLSLVRQHCELPPGRPAVRLLTQWRTWGMGFSPVTFYYVFAHRDDTDPAVIVPEVTNTPWHDRYQYVLATDPAFGGIAASEHRHGQWHFNVDKRFHVSPFMPMDQSYRWQFGVPGESLRMTLHNDDDDGHIFTAWMQLDRQPVNRKNLGRVLRQYPLMTWHVLWGIYKNAFQLWWKKVPYHAHPPGGIRR